MNRNHISSKLAGWGKMYPTLMGLVVIIGVTATANAWRSTGDGGPTYDLTRPDSSSSTAGRRAGSPSDTGDLTAESGGGLCWYKQKVQGCRDRCPLSPFDCQPQSQLRCAKLQDCPKRFKQKASCDRDQKGCKAIRKRCGCSDPGPAACCFVDGSCEDLSFTDCTDRDGHYNIAQKCDSFECGQPAACCFGDGSCADLPQPFCTQEDGLWHDGQACDSFDCPQPGACCINNVSCEMLTEGNCQARHGDFRGEGVSCRRACLCKLVRSLKAECNDRGGVSVKIKFKDDSRNGEGITVRIESRRFSAEIRGKTAKLRACCFNDETRVSLAGLEGCVDAVVVTCPPPLPGACCIDDSTCEFLRERDCRDLGGSFKGQNSPCREFTCPCPLIKNLDATCRGRTIKTTVTLHNKSRNGETVTIAIDEGPPIEVEISGKKAQIWKCCFEGEHTISLVDPQECVEPKVVKCP